MSDPVKANINKKYDIFCKITFIYSVITFIGFLIFLLSPYYIEIPETINSIRFHIGEGLIYHFFFGGFLAPIIFPVISIIFAVIAKDKKLFFSLKAALCFIVLIITNALQWYCAFLGG